MIRPRRTWALSCPGERGWIKSNSRRQRPRQIRVRGKARRAKAQVGKVADRLPGRPAKEKTRVMIAGRLLNRLARGKTKVKAAENLTHRPVRIRVAAVAKAAVKERANS